LTVGYIPGKENDIADILSRWAYPASQVFRDISIHGNINDVEEAEKILRQEKFDEKDCMAIVFRKLPTPDRENGGKTCNNESSSELTSSEDTESSVNESESDDVSHVQPVSQPKRFQFAKRRGRGEFRSTSSNAPQEEILFEAESGEGEGEAQTPPPQHLRSPEGGGVAPSMSQQEGRPGLRTGPESRRGAPETKSIPVEQQGGHMCTVHSPHFLVLCLPHV
jgi:hypothetical protein